ncbi:hypothetical protein Ahy_A10g049723 [Arachis hypogaea]|uniref:CCHC-type domain-containing protein n=1 Tax=Arachis hypogaea TaxID=3818 RepID=A0A445B7S9_ARAHY|nr:hypothetical protein Ahy_A10g049723 [Arachis hypogaea]
MTKPIRVLWECARCTSQDGFLESIKKIERVNKEAWEYLNKWPRDSWSRAFFNSAPKIDNICNNACEVFNSRIKEARAKPIITLLEEVRLYAMRSIARNKVKLNSNTGMPCVHACAALARVGRRPDEFCHQWLTMEAYNNTYAFHINPIPGQAVWEKSPHNRPQAPKFKKKPGPLTKKRRKDADEEPSGGKKQKKKMKRIYHKGHCRYCGESGHMKRNYGKRTADDVVAAATKATAAAKVAATEAAAIQSPAANGGEATIIPEPPLKFNLKPINHHCHKPMTLKRFTKLYHIQSYYVHVLPPPVRPPKLPPKRKSSKQEKATPGSNFQAGTTAPAATPPATSQPTTLPPSHPMQGASQGTVTRLFNFMKFVPSPGFRPPRNKK